MSGRDLQSSRALRAAEAGHGGGAHVGGPSAAGAAIDEANRVAVERMAAVRPLLVGVARAGDVVPGLRPGMLLHAGPPIDWERAVRPPAGGRDRRAALREAGAGRGGGRGHGRRRARSRFEPCHHHDAVGPMAGVTSPSMPVYVVENADPRQPHLLQPQRGLRQGAALRRLQRRGARSTALDERRARPAARPRARARRAASTCAPSSAEALHMGDEGHNRNKAGSLLFLKALAPLIVAGAPVTPSAPPTSSSSWRQRAERAQPGDGGLQGDGRRRPRRRGQHHRDRRWPATAPTSASGSAAWATAGSPRPPAVPDGLYFPGFSAADANPDIGDSTITETAGIGAFAMAAAPAIVTFVGGTPQDAINATLEMYEITVAEHTHFTIPPLDFRGTPTGIDIRRSSSWASRRGSTPASPTARRAWARSAPGWCARRWRRSSRR